MSLQTALLMIPVACVILIAISLFSDWAIEAQIKNPASFYRIR